MLQGKCALVTGASRGIGRAIAIKLAGELNLDLMLAGRDVVELEKTRLEVEALGVKAHVFALDLALENAAEKIISETIKIFGRLDIIINNAGIAISGPVEKTTIDEWNNMMNINARTPFFICKEAIPYLRKSDHATIINISSAVGRKGYKNQGAYCASKHALMGMTKVLAQEVQKDNIRVHVIAPGGVATEMITKMRPDINQDELIQPEEIANIAIFLIKNRGNAMIDEINVSRASNTPWI